MQLSIIDQSWKKKKKKLKILFQFLRQTFETSNKSEKLRWKSSNRQRNTHDYNFDNN